MNDPVNHVFYPNLSVPPDIFHGEYNDQSEIPEDRAIRRGRRTAHKEISPLVGDKTLSLKQRIVKNFNRNLAEKTYLKSIDEEAKAKYVLRACVHDVIKADLAKGNRDPVVVRSELENMERIIDENKLQEKLALEKLEEDIYDNNQRAEMKEHVMKQFISGKSNGSIINAELNVRRMRRCKTCGHIGFHDSRNCPFDPVNQDVKNKILCQRCCKHEDHDADKCPCPPFREH